MRGTEQQDAKFIAELSPRTADSAIGESWIRGIHHPNSVNEGISSSQISEQQLTYSTEWAKLCWNCNVRELSVEYVLGKNCFHIYEVLFVIIISME